MMAKKKGKFDGVAVGKTFYIYSLWLDRDHICPTCREVLGENESFYCILDELDLNRAVEIFVGRKVGDVFCDLCIETNIGDEHNRNLLEREFMSRIWGVEPREPSDGLLGVLIGRVLIPRGIAREIERVWDELEHDMWEELDMDEESE
jgi:hypothetical protein